MATWSRNNPSCVMTWITLAILDQSKKAFPRSDKVKIRSFLFWTGSSSDALRTARRRPLAIQIDSVFREMFGSKYESGVTRAKAVNGMTAVLARGDATMPEFAEVNNTLYRFMGEGDRS